MRSHTGPTAGQTHLTSGAESEGTSGALNPHSSWKAEAHIHPFLSPDGSMGFFNSDESGTVQAYMIRGLDRF